MNQRLLQQLADLVGAAHVRHDEESLQRFGVDRTSVWPAAPTAIVLPESIEQVQKIVRLANANSFAIVPSGGRTGLSGGAVAAQGEVVVAMDRMNHVLEVDTIDRTIRCQAGVITRQLQEAAEAAGLYYPVDFASSGSSQIGGNIATNAGGIKVIRYGPTRDWVLGLTVVTGVGEILHLNKGLIKNNAGYDLRQLFIGSEGTLGLICEATLRLTRQPKDLQVMVLAVKDFETILAVLKTFTSRVELTAFEFFPDRGLQEVLNAGNVAAPFATTAPFYVLLEYDCLTLAVKESAETAFVECSQKGWVLDGVASQTQTQARNLWRLREDLPEVLLAYKPYKNDLSVRVSKMPEFMAAVERSIAQYCQALAVVWFGHIGDGNLHLNVLKPEGLSQEQFSVHCAQINDALAERVQEFAGSISAEHGVGLLKKDYLLSTRSQFEMDIMRQFKRVLDPAGIMNPGKIF